MEASAVALARRSGRPPPFVQQLNDHLQATDQVWFVYVCVCLCVEVVVG